MNASKATPSIRPGFLRPADAARYVGVAPRTLRAWQARRMIPFSRVGRKCVLLAVRDLDAFAAAHRVEAVGVFGAVAVHERPGSYVTAALHAGRS
jgi:excisionase family DNA binding protein